MSDESLTKEKENSMVDMSGISSALQKQLEILREQFEKITLPQIAPIDLSINPIINPALYETLNKHQIEIRKILAPLTNIPIFPENMSDEIKKSIMILANKGWYIDLEFTFSEISELADLVNNGSASEVDTYLCEYYENHIQQLKEFISRNLSNREDIILAALKAHENGEYVLSVPVLMIQVDGICMEVTKGYLFMTDKKTKKPQPAKFVDKYAQQFTNHIIKLALMEPLAQKHSINFSCGERGDSFTELNRHEVIHGDDLSYGTRINSCKAISLLNYVVQILGGIKENICQ